ncbi:hypothetical protein [Streptomyces guryensis]|uniref:Uncharacterized protein n=1 Tax=Streptomyces guryensis TaxID=2886947 RepID=A0A9Q3ZAE0_9ACTN|nr:hypothetical protein [Streptomyces guryensis]MCD9880753.1 hypothetical protein [Streptomyces guryensis]
MTVDDRQIQDSTLRHPGSTPRVVTRRGVEIGLGALWLVDGALQFQPAMFTRGFFVDTLGMANMGLPGPVATVEYDLTSMLAARPALWNALFATLQVALGVGLLWRRTARPALALSVLWALGVWTVGEGFGGLFMSGTDLLTGAPGAALLYALVALALWPRPDRAGPSIADGGVPGGAVTRWAWLVVWVGTAALELESAAHVPAAQLANTGEGEPAVVAAVNHAAGGLVSGWAAAFVVVLGLLQVAVGVGVLAPRMRRPALAAGIGLAVATGLLGQDLGGLLTGHATDPGTGPPLVLFALTLWPRATIRTSRTAAPAHTPSRRDVGPKSR